MIKIENADDTPRRIGITLEAGDKHSSHPDNREDLE